MKIVKVTRITNKDNENKATRFIQYPKAILLEYTFAESENVIFDGENVIFDGEQVIAE